MPQPTLRLAGPQDAGAIARAITACYGDSYLVPAAIEPGRLALQLQRGDLVYAIGETGGGVVGQVALERLNEHGLYHHCRAVVAPEWRGRGFLRRLSELLLSDGARPADARLVLGTSVTSHTFTQRYNVRAGFSPLGLLLGLHPDQTLAELAIPAQAGSAVLMALSCTRGWRPRRLALSGPARDQAAWVCRRLGIPLDDARPLETKPLWEAWEEAPGGLWHLRYASEPAQGPRPPALPALEWVDVPAEHAATAGLLARWQGAGLSPAAYVPLGGPGGEDVLRLQRCRRPLALDGIQIVEELRPLRDWVFGLHAERQEVLA